MNENEELWAAFWCGLLHELIHEDPGPAERGKLLRDLAAKEHRCPDGRVHHFSVSTLRRRLRSFRKNRLRGFLRKIRLDRGVCRAIPATALDILIDLKRDLPTRSADTLNRMLQERAGKTLARSTLYRHLKQAGATRLKLGMSGKVIRRRWTRDHPHDIWVGDFEEGPFVEHGGEVVPTNLSAFIDGHSRFVVLGRYYLRQNLAVLEDSLLRALAVHGAPLEIYLDNAKVYRSRAYKLLCAEFGIHPVYRTPGDPAPGGLIERFFRTVQEQFEAEVRPQALMTLDQLNTAFAAWLDMVYHDRIHSEIEQTPRQRLESGKGPSRRVELERISGIFLTREIRKVDPVYADISINRRLYRVDARLRGDKVEARFDPFADLDRVLLYSLDGKALGEGLRYDRDLDRRGESEKRNPGRPKTNLLDDLRAQHSRRLQRQAEGIDFRRLPSGRTYPFATFVGQLADGLGLKGGLSAFDAGQLEHLKKFWSRHANLRSEHLNLALAEPGSRELGAILHHLQCTLTKEP